MILALLGLAAADELAGWDKSEPAVVEQPAPATEVAPEDPRQQLIRDWAPKVQVPVQEAWVRGLEGVKAPRGEYAAYLQLTCGPERKVVLLRSSGYPALDEALVKAATETAWPDPPDEILEAFGGTFTIDLGFTLNADVPPEGKLHLPE